MGTDNFGCTMLLFGFDLGRPTFGEILKQLLLMRAADSSPTPALNVTLRLHGPPTNSSSTPSNGADSRGQLAAVTGVAGSPVSARAEAPLIIIGSTAHVSFYTMSSVATCALWAHQQPSSVLDWVHHA